MERVNGILIDWLSVTSKTMMPEDVMKLIGLPAGWEYMDRGVRGYGERYYNNGISIHFGGMQDTVWLEMSGQGCRTFESDSAHGNYNVIFGELLRDSSHMNITRLDVAYDDFSGILDIGRICDDTRPRNARYKSKTDYAQVIESTNGMSCDVGSPKSSVLVRIYDKLAERLAKMRGADDREKVRETIPHWVRVELQLRDDRALEFVKYLRGADTVTPTEGALEIGQAYRGCLQNYLDYGYTDSDGNWRRFAYWENLLQSASALSVYRKPGKGYNLERMLNFVQNNAGNAISAAIEILGPDRFFNLIEDRKIEQSSKYMQLIQQHGRYEDKLNNEVVADWLNRLPPVSKEDREDRHPFYVRFAKPERVIWNGVRHLMCRECNAILPESGFTDVSLHSNFATCYKCASKKE